MIIKKKKNYNQNQTVIEVDEKKKVATLRK